jgi:hypothetical protein
LPSSVDLIRAVIEMKQRNPTWGSGPFGPGLARRFDENSRRYFCCTSARWKFNNVDGFNAIATRPNRLGLIQSEQNPAINRSTIRRFGARRRERFTINN